MDLRSSKVNVDACWCLHWDYITGKLLWYNTMIVISETPLVSKKSFLKHHHLCIWDAWTAPKLIWGCMSLQLVFCKYVLHRYVQVTCSRGNAAMRLLARNWTQLLSLVVLTRFANLGWWTGIAAPDPFTGTACKQFDFFKKSRLQAKIVEEVWRSQVIVRRTPLLDCWW